MLKVNKNALNRTSSYPCTAQQKIGKEKGKKKGLLFRENGDQFCCELVSGSPRACLVIKFKQ